MILYIATLLVKFFGIDLSKAKRYVVISLVILAIFIILITFSSIKSCFTKQPVINQESIQKINTANEKERKEELQKVIENNSDVVKTVGERNSISEVSIEQRDKAIEDKIKEADKKIQEAKNNGKDVTQEELKCILVPENCQ